MVDDRLRFVSIPFRSNLLSMQPLGTKRPIFDIIEVLIEDFVSSAPSGLQTVFQYCVDWSWMITEEALVLSLLKGLAICFPIAFVVLLMATQNIFIALYATMSIGFIVLSVLGACKAYFDWNLGISESIAGIIVIGFSVDYVVHLGHMYMEGGHELGLKT